MTYSPEDKITLVTAWFNEIDEIIDDLNNISDKKHYRRIATPVLYTILERMAWFRYRQEQISSSERFKNLLLTYSNHHDELQKIDLAFLYAWDTSEYKETAIYVKAIKKIHNKIKPALSKIYGSISTNMQDRFVDIHALHQALIKKGICPTCLVLENLKLFNACEVIYRFGRCKAIHEGEFISVGFIDLPLLIKITQDISNNLKKLCLEQKKLPDEL